MGLNIETTLSKQDGDPYYSPEFARGGLKAQGSVKTTHFGGSGTVKVTLQHRNAADVAFTDAGDTGAISTKTVTALQADDILEICRRKFEVGGPGATSSVSFIMPPLQWYPYT